MSGKESRKVRRVEVEKVKDGSGGHLHKVTVHHHDRPAKEGKGMKHIMSSYEPPEETYHKSAAKAHGHMKKAMARMTATPEEPIQQGEGMQSGMSAQPPNDADEATEAQE